MELSDLLKPLAATTETTAALVVLLLPLLGFLVLFFLGKRLPRRGDWLSIGLTLGSFILSGWLFLQTWNTATFHCRTTWFNLPASSLTDFTAGILLDNLTVLMLVIVTFISLLVQLFSVGYMHGDKGYSRYFAYLGLFTFSMIGIVVVDNLLLLFMFWELVGLSSYLLIGFWIQKPAAVAANKKAFLFNRVGDIGLLLGLFAFYTYFRTFDLEALRTLVGSGNWESGSFVSSYTLNAQGWIVELGPIFLTLAGLGLFMGCVGKSAQFPLQVWLPDAMQGPTPVSALIHAATMVAAGVYLVARCYAFFTPPALVVIAFVGALTALIGALAALNQNDIKAVLAFSTISQLGYMVMGMGTGAHDAALFHLATHAFFKATLFLNAGIIIHAMHRGLHRHHLHLDAQDIRHMGGLRKALPLTFYIYITATAALVGLPLFSGFLSKDAILSGSWAWAQTMSANGSSLYFVVPIIGFSVVLLTAFYMARHMWFIFFGEFRASFRVQDLRLKAGLEVERVMALPVILLAILSLGIFFSLNPLNFSSSWLLQGISLSRLSNSAILSEGLLQAVRAQDEANHTLHIIFGVLSTLLALVGISWAVLKYKNSTSQQLLQVRPKYKLAQLSHNQFQLNEFYQRAFVQPSLLLAKGLYRTDKRVIDYTLNNGSKALVIFAKIVAWFDRWVVDGLVWLVGALSKVLGRVGRGLQNGKVQSYYAYSLFGFILLMLYIILF
ncbi:NADH-quinone oxidoreductase subunit L [Pontibacter akesuensis]|uniref:NADH dehydrogenase subunit L n=1 Tax=Pontibacter akesuensis TaxID=388950 RepID=A0A1I7KLK3_9BACT|nr:NADH-quinone oxidoreductase subunit L [Pontibacter akesuensis]GHA77867.1 NADH-quinone oxidoreductase subunit L [Pontibacter akesuensis]SFU98315.1 NADH dehydrogenase subunit L [Pontibacter akesuensis]